MNSPFQIIFVLGKFQYFRIGGHGYVQKRSVNAEFKTFDPHRPNTYWITTHRWPLSEVLDFARTVKLLGLEGEIDE